MNVKNTIKLISFVGVLLSATSNSVLAGTVSFSDPVPDGGISYEWTVKLNKNDTTNFTRHVGAKSWN